MGTMKRPLACILCILVLISLAAALTGCLGLAGLIAGSQPKETPSPAAPAKPAPVETVPGEDTLEQVDAAAYFAQRARVLSVTDAADPDRTLTEAEACALLKDRGFTQCPLTYSYTDKGDLTEETVCDPASSAAHPMYQTWYISEGEELWQVLLVGDALIASPLSYRMTAGSDTELFLSEEEWVLSYDSATHQFFETLPHESIARVLQAEEINAQLLETMTGEELAHYEK